MTGSAQFGAASTPHGDPGLRFAPSGLRTTRFLGETISYFFARWEATGRLFRERESAIDANFEDAATRAPQAQLRRGSQLSDQFPRLTGARFITSLTAVFDLDFHDFVLTT
jgi:hypothetical protein